MKKTIFLFTILIINISVKAQDSKQDSINLKPVIIEASRANYSINSGGTSIITRTIRTEPLKEVPYQNLADVLNLNSELFIKSYGLGSLATPSFRGTGSNHTAVLWNGFNLQSPMNGTVDLALLPAFFLDGVTTRLGGSSALFGSGAIGGSILLNNFPLFHKHIYVANYSTIGSFGDWQQGLSFELGNKNFYNKTSVYYHKAKNNFEFEIEDSLGNLQSQKMENANLIQKAWLQENAFRFGKNQKLKLMFWFQDNDRNIPGTLDFPISHQKQIDQSMRSSLEWKLKAKKMDFAARTAFFDENISYSFDPISSSVSESRFKKSISELESNYHFNDSNSLNFGLNLTLNQAQADAFSTGTDFLGQNFFSIFASYAYNKKKWKVIGNLRQQFTDNKATPIMPRIGIAYKVKPNIFIRANTSRNYNIPNLNDIFWKDPWSHGNPDLKPEIGWTNDLGVVFDNKKNTVRLEINYFYNRIKDWIIWLPDSNFIFSPRNSKLVESQGIEVKLEADKKIFKKSYLKFNANYQFVSSKNKASNLENDPSLEKQLIYVPKHNANAQLSFEKRNFKAIFIENFTSERFYLTDNSASLPEYFISNFVITQGFHKKKYSLNISARINNIFNEKYQILNNRPMPGRNFQFGIYVVFKN